MIEKSVKKRQLNSDTTIQDDLAYWLAKTPEERIAAVEFLRRQHHGSTARIQRVARVVRMDRR
ncbi:MAG: hypothetical protein ACLFV4_03785 [Candidatus Hydrogenedentota bacterium]